MFMFVKLIIASLRIFVNTIQKTLPRRIILPLPYLRVGKSLYSLRSKGFCKVQKYRISRQRRMLQALLHFLLCWP